MKYIQRRKGRFDKNHGGFLDILRRWIKETFAETYLIEILLQMGLLQQPMPLIWTLIFWIY